MRYELVAFDFDGTLADTIPWFEDIINRVAERYGCRKLDADGHAFLRQCSAREAMRYLEIPLWKVPLVARHIRRVMADTTSGIALFEGIGTALQACRAADLKLAIVSTNTLSNVCRGLGEANVSLIDYFECDASFLGKAPQLRRLLRTSGVAPRRAILVGDEARDIAAAKKVGMCAGAVGWGYQPMGRLLADAPEEAFHRVSELVPRLVGQSDRQGLSN